MRIRGFDRSDVEALALAHNAIGGASGAAAKPHDGESMRRMLEQPGCDPERHCFIAELDGAVAGYALIAYEQPIARAVALGGVLPNMRGKGVGRALVRKAVEHSEALGVDALHVEAGEENEALKRLMLAEGFEIVKHYWQMRWQGGSAPEFRMPLGFAVRPLTPGGDDEAALTILQNTAFGENWGFSPNTVEQISARVEQNIGGPESILFITEQGEPAAYNWTMFSDDGANPSGVISMTGVHPNYRGIGLGRAVVAAGIAYLVGRGAAHVDLEVDSDNAPARGLYLNLGFRIVSKTLWYEKRFRGRRRR